MMKNATVLRSSSSAPLVSFVRRIFTTNYFFANAKRIIFLSHGKYAHVPIMYVFFTTSCCCVAQLVSQLISFLGFIIQEDNEDVK